MRNTYKVVLTLFLLALLPGLAGAQTRTYSPYSRFGLGDVQGNGFGRNDGMGHTGIALTSEFHLNNANPASYAYMDSVSFFFEGGVTGFRQKIKTDNMDAKFSDMNFSYFAIGFPFSKWGFISLGIKPETMAGYKFFHDNSSSYDVNHKDYEKNNVSGEGNMTKAYGGIAIRPVPNLSVGAHFSYLFGNLEHFSLTQFPNVETAYKIGASQKVQANSFLMDFGVQYDYELKDGHSLIFGATYQPKTSISGEINQLKARGYTLQSNGLQVNPDVIDYQKDADLSDSELELPERFGLGVSYNVANYLTVAADYTKAQWGDINLPQRIKTDLNSITDAEKFAVGAEFIPNDRSADSYLSRMRYRMGASYKKDYIVFEGEQIKDFGITFGFGLPLKRSKTSFNFAFEVGQRGKTTNNLVKENYMRFTLNLTFHEFWFMKRQFD